MKNTQIAFNSAAFNGNEHEIPMDTRNLFRYELLLIVANLGTMDSHSEFLIG